MGHSMTRTRTAPLSAPRRWWDDLLLRHKGFLVIAIPLVPLLISTALVVQSAGRGREAQRDVMRTLDIKTEIATIYGLTADAETGVRGYLLTRHPDALKVVQEATKPLRGHYDRLFTLIDDAEVRRHLERVIELGRERPVTSLIDYVNQTAPGAPVPFELLARSRATMAQLRGELAAMQAREDQLLEMRTTAARRAEDNLLAVTLTGAALGLAGSLIGAFVFTTGIARRVEKLQANAGRLARGEELTHVADGRDEVGDLDRVLREASALLQQRDRELTARVRELEEIRGELDQFFSLSLDMLCIAGLDGRFRRVNRAWREALGWSEDDLVSVPFVDFVHPEDVAATVAQTAGLADGHTTVGFENRYRAIDGSYRWLSWKAAADPARGMIYAAARDITDEKRAAEVLKEHVVELAAVNQELEAFSYSVSHDLRAPLRHVSGFAGLLEQHAGSALDAQSQRFVTTIKDAASRMGRLIDDLLAFSRIGRTALAKQPVNLAAVVDAAKAELQPELDGREVVWNVHPLPEVEGDPAMLRLVIVNLLSNALKYSSTQPRTEIEVGTRSERPDEVVLFVRDNGVGFDMQYAHKLFGVFQRLHTADQFAGTGIGLANVRRIIHRHGGRTWAEGVVNGGATFYLSLPVDGAHA